ncbi:MAG: PIN domain-containing protein [Planctomycetes bacterium]|nr:PIN domain-containing protein [Planctomycetota bacterium]
MSSFTVIYDTNVLYPNEMRDILVEIAAHPSGVVRARWSSHILEELRRTLHEKAGIELEKLDNMITLMGDAVRDALVEGYEELIVGLEGLPDPNDRHVLAAAIRAHAQVIVTQNLKDFPPEYLQKFGMEAQSADVYLRHLVELAPGVVYGSLREISQRRKRAPKAVRELVDAFEACGMPLSMGDIRQWLDSNRLE